MTADIRDFPQKRRGPDDGVGRLVAEAARASAAAKAAIEGSERAMAAALAVVLATMPPGTTASEALPQLQAMLASAGPPEPPAAA